MKLRYLHVLDNPPLHDVRVVFRQEPVLQRACAIRFVVGVNGTGKTRLLQALATAFLSLERRQQFPFPLTLVYDLGRAKDARTLLLHVPREGRRKMALIEFDHLLNDRPEHEWEILARNDWKAITPTAGDVRSIFTGGDLPGGGSIGAYLPRALLAYTSGATPSWEVLFRPAPVLEDISALPLIGGEDATLVEERPPGWTSELESAYQRQQGNTLTMSTEIPDSEAEFSDTSVTSVGQLITADALPLTMCAIALHQFVTEFKKTYTQETLLQAIAQADDSGDRMPGLRGLLNEVGWGWLEGLHLEIAFDPDLLSAPVAKPFLHSLKKLYELASVAIRQPEPSNLRQLHFDLFKPAPDNSDQLTGEALFDVLREESGTAYDAYRRLRDLQAIGLLNGLTMTLNRPGIDDILLYDWLSDGERMFLGRMALFHLMAGEDDALIILDEPETHFNDYWKREIVDIIDDSLGGDHSEVIISSHSSIALTDVFSEEIELLRKENGEVVAHHVRIPTFGADPSEIMIQIFDAPDSIGKRAQEYLDHLLDRAWRSSDREELHNLVPNIGAGYYRSELRSIFRGLDALRD